GGERLFATHFDGARAYVVTYKQTDPLWVVDLSVPQRPLLAGAAWVPGWSDFVFPRGDTLLAVGRGNRGVGLQVTLFDVTNAAAPYVLAQLAVGDWSASSEANADHRAVTVLEDGMGAVPLLLVPYTSAAGASCNGRNVVQLVDV